MWLDHIKKTQHFEKKKPKNHLCDKRTQNHKKKQTKPIWKKKRFFEFSPGGGAGSFLTFSPGGQGAMDSLFVTKWSIIGAVGLKDKMF